MFPMQSGSRAAHRTALPSGSALALKLSSQLSARSVNKLQVCEHTPAPGSWFLAELRPDLWSVYVDIHKAAAVFKEEEEMLVLVAAVVKPNP